MRLFIVLGLTVFVALGLAYWLLRPTADSVSAGNVAVGNAVADQMAIDQANSDIANEERAAAIGLNASDPAGNAARQR